MAVAIQVVCLAVTMACISQLHGLPFGSSSSCSRNSDCGPDECCALGLMRYSFPQCLPLGQLDDYCRLDNVAENRTLYYPMGLGMDVEVYTHVCPCSVSLSCQEARCRPLEAFDDNFVF